MERRNLPNPRLDIFPGNNLAQLIGAMRYFSQLSELTHTKIYKLIRGRESVQGALENTAEFIQRIYGFDSPKIALEYFLEAQRKSADFISDLIETFGLPDRFGQKNEVNIPDPNLSRLLKYLSNKPNDLFSQGVSRRLIFERYREFWLIDIILRNIAKGVEEEPFDKIGELQRKFNDELYSGKAGEGRQVLINFKVDDKNCITEISLDEEEESNGEVNKIEGTHNFITLIKEARLIRIDDVDYLVLVDFHKKNGLRKLSKVIGDFVESDQREINFTDYRNPLNGKELLRDRQRFRVVLLRAGQKELITHDGLQTIIKTILSYFSKDEDVEANFDHGQSPSFEKRFFYNYQVIPFEIQFYDLRGYLNSLYHVGDKIKYPVEIAIGGKKHTVEFNIYNGSAYSLYEIRRTLSLLFYMFPYEIYRREKRDQFGNIVYVQSEEEYIQEMIEAVERKSDKVANDLKKMLEKN